MSKNLNRIISFAFKDFSRNKGISAAAIFVLVISMLLVTGLLFFHGIASYLALQIQNKIDVTAYFKNGTPEDDILEVKGQILKMSDNIKSVEYISQDQALVAFNQKHGNNAVLSKALQEVGDNPFLPSLNIVTNGDPSQYEQISSALQNSDFSKMIDRVDFSQKKDTIKKVYSITSNINKFGILLGVILVVLAMLVVYNTIKLAVDGSKEEIATMKIVGASDSFVRGPFMIQGIIYGVIAFLICFFISVLVAILLSPEISMLLPGFSMIKYFLTKSWIFVLIQLGFGVAVGAISSFIVVRKYLDV